MQEALWFRNGFVFVCLDWDIFRLRMAFVQHLCTKIPNHEMKSLLTYSGSLAFFTLLV